MGLSYAIGFGDNPSFPRRREPRPEKSPPPLILSLSKDGECWNGGSTVVPAKAGTSTGKVPPPLILSLSKDGGRLEWG